jgi:hypothetical protein
VSSDEKLAPGYLDNPPDVQKLLEANPSFHGVNGSNAGLAGVWAESNTRESSTTRSIAARPSPPPARGLRVRLFAGFDYPGGITKQRNWVKTAYESGVAMGSDLSGARASGKPLRIVVQAVKDPDAGNLDRIQIVKVWLEDGKAKERIFDVAWAGNRSPDAKGPRAADWLVSRCPDGHLHQRHRRQ